jgi:hypothetical protein
MQHQPVQLRIGLKKLREGHGFSARDKEDEYCSIAALAIDEHKSSLLRRADYAAAKELRL